jgi:MFS family permease
MLPAKTPTEASGFKALLKNRAFLLLWTGQIFSQVDDKVLLVMSIALLTTYRIPIKYAASSDSYLMVSSTIPAILFGVAAGIFVDRYPKKQVMVVSNVLLGFIGMGITLIIFTFIHDLLLGIVCAGILGLGASLIAVPMQTLIQEKTPESMRGKVFGFQNIAVAVPLIIVAPLAEQFGLPSVLWGMSIVVTVAGILA